MLLPSGLALVVVAAAVAVLGELLAAARSHRSLRAPVLAAAATIGVSAAATAVLLRTAATASLGVPGSGGGGGGNSGRRSADADPSEACDEDPGWPHAAARRAIRPARADDRRITAPV